MSKKIMIVDDDADILVTLRIFFEKNDFEVIAVDSGKDCIEELQNGFKGVVLLDITMPFMDGWETLREITHLGLNDQVNILIITANAWAQDQSADFSPYVCNIISKPFNLEELISSVNT
jgi:DNA-binding response OmpR family regulator